MAECGINRCSILTHGEAENALNIALQWAKRGKETDTLYKCPCQRDSATWRDLKAFNLLFASHFSYWVCVFFRVINIHIWKVYFAKFIL